MKKNIFFSVLIATLLFRAVAGLAAEATTKDAAAAKTLAKAESSQGLQTEKLSKESPVVSPQVKTAPIATVSNVEKKEEKVAAAKTETVRTEPVISKASSGILEKKPAEVEKKAAASTTLNSAELQQRWKALFSKEITPGSIAYVVKPGDSLYVIARKNHTTVDLIKKINGLKNDNIYPRMKLKIHTAPFSIRIDKSENVLSLYSNGEVVKKYSVATGKKNCTPVGDFKITDKLVNPTWFKTGAILPPGSPENALGSRWMGLDKPAYGIHGTIEPKSIGTQASEGCIRMLNEEVEELYSIVPVGTKVTIKD